MIGNIYHYSEWFDNDGIKPKHDKGKYLIVLAYSLTNGVLILTTITTTNPIGKPDKIGCYQKPVVYYFIPASSSIFKQNTWIVVLIIAL